MEKILILGANSAIAKALARRQAETGPALFLCARDGESLRHLSEDLRVRGAVQVATEVLDLRDSAAVSGLVERAAEALGGLDLVVVAAGVLPDQAQLDQDPSLLREVFEVNALAPMQLLAEAANRLEAQGQGCLLAIGSVAGDRGRATNTAYGAAKGALEIFLSGLRQRLHAKGVRVLLVKPGFVDTPMTAACKKGPLWATPERVADDILRALHKSRAVIYTPWFWRWILLIIRHLPEAIFVRLRF
jgi:short-subunit dehydrogenase